MARPTWLCNCQRCKANRKLARKDFDEKIEKSDTPYLKELVTKENLTAYGKRKIRSELHKRKKLGQMV